MLVEPLYLNLDVIDPAQSMQVVNKVITLINVESRRVAFKIRTTSRDRFSTTPNCGLLGPGQEVDVIVAMRAFSEMQYKELSSNMVCNDKFLFRSVPASDDVTEDLLRGEGAQAWWNDGRICDWYAKRDLRDPSPPPSACMGVDPDCAKVCGFSVLLRDSPCV